MVSHLSSLHTSFNCWCSPKKLKKTIGKTYTLGTDFEKMTKKRVPWPRPLYRKNGVSLVFTLHHHRTCTLGATLAESIASPIPSPLNCGLGPFTWWLPSLQLFQLFAHSPVPQDIHWGCWTGWINSKSLCTGYWLLDCHHGLGPWLPSFSPMQKYFYNILLCHKVLGLATTFPSIFGAHLKNN